jgi:dsRNA-specific ribonuclease
MSTDAAAVVPSGAAFEYVSSWMGEWVVRMRCLGADMQAVVVRSLDELVKAMEALSRETELYVDGEFEEVVGMVDGAYKTFQRMALLTLHASGSDAVYMLHLPSLLRPWQSANVSYGVPPGQPGVRDLYALLGNSGVRKTWWGGTASDAYALLCALPDAAPLLGFRDLQTDTALQTQAGALPPGTPLALAPLVEAALGVPMDKSLQCADWANLPTPAMAAYAACDAVVLSQLARALDDKTLGAMLAPSAPKLLAAAHQAGKADRMKQDFVSGLTLFVRAMMGGAALSFEQRSSGPSHAPVFAVTVSAPGLPGRFVGSGSTKVLARQAAARAACASWIDGEPLGGDEGQPWPSGPAQANTDPRVRVADSIDALPAVVVPPLGAGVGPDVLEMLAERFGSCGGPGGRKCMQGDYVSGLNEWAQHTPGARVAFLPAQRTGPDHRPSFSCEVVVRYPAHEAEGGMVAKRYQGVGTTTAKAAKRLAALSACAAVMLPRAAGALM